MLYSAKYKFIYSKSVKTASTSVEAALEYLIRDDFAVHESNSKLYPDGSRIGYRGSNPTEDPNFNTSAFSYNHQPLEAIKNMIGIDSFNSSFKISSIRNPYDTYISGFHHFCNQNIPEYINLKRNGRTDEIKTNFANYVNHIQDKTSIFDGKIHFFCDSEMLIDKFVRMESITNDMEEIFYYLKVPKEISKTILLQFPKFKLSGRADSSLNIPDYYTEETLEIVNQTLSDWFGLGGYVRCQSIEELKKFFCKL